MAVVLDASALVALSFEERGGSVVERIMEDELCYMSPSNVAQAYFMLRKYASPARAEHILEMITANKGIRIVSDADRDIIEMAGRVMEFGVSTACCFSAALAHKMKIPVVTNDQDFDAIEKAGFCKVRRV